MAVFTEIQLRRDTAANWVSVNPILALGEMGIETDTVRAKVGDGITAWNSLGYLTNQSNTVVITQTATAGQSLFAFSQPYAQGINAITVYQNGSRLNNGVDYTETTTTSITLISSATAGDSLTFVIGEVTQSTFQTSSSIQYQPAGTGAVTTNVQAKLRQTVSVLDFGADPTGVVDSTAGFNAAIAAAPAYGTVFFPAGSYLGTLSIQRSNLTLRGAGSASTIIKAGTLSTGGVIELGNTALGNSAPAYTNLTVYGMTVDGNFSTITQPTDDLHGHGLCTTNCNYVTVDDFVAQNCWNTGVGTFINSNFCNMRVRVKNCGNATPGGGHYPNFDINSSKYSIYDVVSENGYYGARMLDNCWGNHLRASIYNASISGAVYNNQTVNQSYANKLDLNVVGGCSAQGVYIGPRCFDSIINATVGGVTGVGFKEAGVSAGGFGVQSTVAGTISGTTSLAVTSVTPATPGVSAAPLVVGQALQGAGLGTNTLISAVTNGGVAPCTVTLSVAGTNGAVTVQSINQCPTGNIYNVSTYQGQQQGIYIASNNNIWNISSNQDGRSSQGSYYAIDVNGNFNLIDAIVQDFNAASPYWWVRGIVFRSGATGNNLRSYQYTVTVDPCNDAGTNTVINHGPGVGVNIASTNTPVIPFQGSVFNITGTSGIQYFSSTGSSIGREITLIFTTSLTVVTSGNIYLSGATNFSITATSTTPTIMKFIYNGTNWIEISRTVI